MGFDKVKSFSIVFSSASEFCSGNVVSGNVILELREQSRVQAVKLHAEGIAKTRFRHVREDVDYLDLREELLHAGQYKCSQNHIL